MTEAKEALWWPKVGSLVTISHTGTSGVVTKTAHRLAPNEQDVFYLKLDSALYFDGSTKVAEKGATVIVSFAPSFDVREKVCIDVLDAEGNVKDFRLLDYSVASPEEIDKWLLVRHPNDGAPKTDRFKFNHWVCWDDGKHESFEPDWRGGHNYDHRGPAPCANVKVSDPGKFLKDRGRVEEQIGKLTDAQWARYEAWVDDEAGSDGNDDGFNLAIEDARRSLDDCFEGTGLEFAYGGRSGGWLCITNACDEDTWGLKALTEEEEAALDGYYELEKELSPEHLDKMRELDERRDNAWCDGDKAVIRAALHAAETYAEDEVAYQFMGIVARRFQDMIEEEGEEEKERLERNQKRQVILDGLNSQNSWRVKLFEAVVAALIYLDSGAAADGWDWDDKFFGDARIEEKLSEAQTEYEGRKDDAENMDDKYPVIKARGMQVVMFNKDGRVGDPIHYTTAEKTPEDFTTEEVREWIEQAKKAGATGIELQGGFDGAGTQEEMDSHSYDPEITSFEVILWEEPKKE